MAEAYRGHPCYGLVGIDPRAHAGIEVGRRNAENLVSFLAQWVGGMEPSEERGK